MNVLLITSDQHNKAVMGCAGDPAVHTPNLDRLAEQGTRFDAAYTNNPICMPARATLATGRYGSAIGSVDNGSAYDGSQPSWGHRLRDAGHQAVTFGKLHFDPEADTGFDARLPLQAKSGYAGALLGWARGAVSPMRALRNNVDAARPGEFEYTPYDRFTAESASSWLENDAPRNESWATHVSFAYPHYPFRVPESYLAGIDPAEIPLPVQWQADRWPDHPAMAFRRFAQSFDEPPIDESTLRHMRWIYYGMVRFLDEQVGRLLDALDRSGMADDTLVIYASDHGDMLGEKGLFMKGVMYDGSAGIPLILRGPDVASGALCNTPVSLIDVMPTVLAATGIAPDAEAPGESLVATAGRPNDHRRVVFSEYHGPTSMAANFMVRRGTTKYVEYLAAEVPPQLFDLAADPDEADDLAADDAETLASMADELRRILDPEAVDAAVRAEQTRLLEEAGGMDALRAQFAGAAAAGPRLGGYTVPPDDIMEIVGWPDDPDWART